MNNLFQNFSEVVQCTRLSLRLEEELTIEIINTGGTTIGTHAGASQGDFSHCQTVSIACIGTNAEDNKFS